MDPTPQQAAFIQAMSEEDNLCMEACAGSGKTTTLVMGVNALPRSVRVTACAFNRRIADVLREVMPVNCTCKTLNGLGHAAWGRRATFGKLEQFKTYDILKDLGVKKVKDECPDMPRLIALAKAHGIVPSGALGGVKEGLTPDDDDVWLDIVEDHGLDLGDFNHQLAREALKVSIAQAWKGKIDFDDQLYMTAIYQGDFDPCDVVVVDEAQDISLIQREMIRQMVGKGRIIAVGDRHQSIYAFRGADHGAIPAFIEEFSCKTLPLTVSFRCPKAVVKEARKYVSHIESHEDAPDGLVTHLDSWGHDTFKPGDVILCRNTKPLVFLAFDLIRAGVGCKVLGKEIGEGLIKLIDKMKVSSVSLLQASLEAHAKSECAKFEAKGKMGQAAALQDRVDAILVISEKCDTIDKLKAAINRMFNDSGQPITLSTIHKAKGLEWHTVYFLDSWLIPSKFAKTESAKQQERNVAYVGVTRAKRKLIYIDSNRYTG